MPADGRRLVHPCDQARWPRGSDVAQRRGARAGELWIWRRGVPSRLRARDPHAPPRGDLPPTARATSDDPGNPRGPPKVNACGGLYCSEDVLRGRLWSLRASALSRAVHAPPGPSPAAAAPLPSLTPSARALLACSWFVHQRRGGPRRPARKVFQRAVASPPSSTDEASWPACRLTENAVRIRCAIFSNNFEHTEKPGSVLAIPAALVAV